jgi:hypothetical protein
MTFIRRLFAISAALLLTACSTPSPNLRLIGTAQLAGDMRVGETRVGGLSGIDYDSVTRQWLIISDDRGVHGPTRFYRARIDYDAQRVAGVQITSMQPLVQAGGAPYARRGEPGQVADLETLRIDPLERSLWFAGEGDRAARSPMLLARTGMDGAPLRAPPFPPALQIQPDEEAGGRSNAGPEGLSFSADGQHLWLAMEGALIQDGQAPGEGALTRLSLLDRQGRILAQYAYRLEPVRVLRAGVAAGPPGRLQRKWHCRDPGRRAAPPAGDRARRAPVGARLYVRCAPV